MYRCGICGLITPANTRAYRRVVETRRREYPFRQKANKFEKDGRRKTSDDPGGVGREIVREVLACPACREDVDTDASDDPSKFQWKQRGPPKDEWRCGRAATETTVGPAKRAFGCPGLAFFVEFRKVPPPRD